MLKLTSYNKNVNIGIVARANDSLAVIPKGASESVEKDVKEVLDVDVVKMNLSGTSLIGAFLAMNNNGAVVSSIVLESEVEELRDAGLKVNVVDDRLNALGNLVIATDKGALAYSGLKTETIKKMERSLGCSVKVVSSLGKYKTIGSLGIATTKGALFHPDVTDKELEVIEKALKVEVDIGTVNMGIGFVRTGLVANKNGALIGENTTGPEVFRIEEALGYL
ncbi:MAG TPA: translation initiation factor IF-6 [Euryarchaeota archaeon]|nr:translation initiation factor IF-6 [archaeon BMS3Bbin15]HDL15645.1 translation initiation factor IF-6 [Euryarchaeota archaeon]